VAGLTDVMELAASGSYVCARKADKTVWCWGDNTSDQLGYDNTSDAACANSTKCNSAPTQVAGLMADSIALGLVHACARVGSSAYCWGDNTYAQLGHLPNTNGDVAQSGSYVNPQPTVASATGVAALFAGGGYVNCMLDGSDTASCWGFDAAGQLGDGAALTKSATPVVIAGLAKSATTIRASYRNVCAAMGTLSGVWCWGDDGFGGDGIATTNAYRAAAAVPGLQSMTVTAIAASQVTDSLCALTDGADVYCWGANLGDVLGNANMSGGGCSPSPCDATTVKVALP
jgi:alpha-tubulin suppressor-like RCC1 family protein